ncbi:RNA polymerase sigma factor [Novilysobacter selenitireducens]|uniref:RNA polymerase sigma factor n=1 Tax=Novilysobacter selenitireducens TaxID=2872639 RepID=A0ABS7T720_9GAMM|nr:sigma-70 family RNA polymerase sigma factor [Lysobacter selenitireducens]MBZ4039686.1 sigma-70 family RNA polymerase sigma factor [Lysobacter selenitireducens]
MPSALAPSHAVLAPTTDVEAVIREHLPAAAQGDTDAYGRIVAACQNPVTAIALAIVRDVPASQDIAQDAFISAWRHLQRLQNPASFLPWLRQITRNLARDHLRARVRGGVPVDDADAVIEAAADPAPDPLHQALEDERQLMAAELISALPDDSREVLLLYYREGQRSQQVAALLGLSDAAVRKRLSRARATVRDELLARFGEFARSSAPAAAFAGIVTSALVLASPPAAAAGILSIGAAAGAKTFGKVLLGAAGSIGFALLAALAGVYLGLRRQLKGAIDAAERHALIRSSVVCALASVGFIITITALAAESKGWLWPVVATAVFMATVFWQAMVVQPRALQRRHAREAALDPTGAARRRRREKAIAWIGAVVGFTCGIGGLLLGLVSSGRI